MARSVLRTTLTSPHARFAGAPAAGNQKALYYLERRAEEAGIGKGGDGRSEGGRHLCRTSRGGTRILRDPAGKRRTRRGANHGNRKWMSGFQQLPACYDCGAQLSLERNPCNYPVAVGASLLGGTNSNTSRAPCSSPALDSLAPRRWRLLASAARSGRGRDRQPLEAWQRYDERVEDAKPFRDLRGKQRRTRMVRTREPAACLSVTRPYRHIPSDSPRSSWQ